MDVRQLELKRLKRADKHVKRQYVTLWKTLTLLFLILALLLTPVSAGAKYLDNAVAARLGGTFWYLKDAEETAKFDTGVKPPIVMPEQVYGQIQAEGMVLLKNDNSALPLQNGAPVSCVSNAAGRAEALQKALANNGTALGNETVIAILTDGTLLPGLNQRKAAGEIGKLILLWDTENPVQPSLWKDSGADAVLWTGGAEAERIAGLLCGASPDGSLPYTGVYDGSNEPNSGFYTGYFYHETRYEDYVTGADGSGEYVYSTQVAYPFGFGLGYTTFTYSDLQVVYDEKSDCFLVTLTVTNTGEKIARETVQIYAQSPYTDYDRENGIEKPAVKLVGFAKTDLLDAGMTADVTVQVPRRELTSFDAKGYILEAGSYYLTAAANAHEAVNNILCAKGYTPENTENRMDEAGNKALTYQWVQNALETYGTETTNLLTSEDEGVSRKDWENTLSRKVSYVQLSQSPYTPGDYPTVPMPTTGAKNGLKLWDMAGLTFDDPMWQTLLDQLTVREMAMLVGDAYNGILPVKSVQAPGVGYAEKSETVNRLLLEATFQPQFAYEISYYAAKDTAGQLLLQGMENSEDSFLSGQFMTAQVQGAKDCGGHVVLQIGEQMPNHGQTLRERTLRALQYAVESVQTTGVATNDRLLIDILRSEWDGKGVVLADNMPAVEGVLTGVTAFSDLLPKTWDLLKYRDDPVIVTALRQACHHHLYAAANSTAMNGIGPETAVKTHWLWSVIGCTVAVGVCYIACVVFAILWNRGSRKWKQTETHLAYQTLKNALKSEQK